MTNYPVLESKEEKDEKEEKQFSSDLAPRSNQGDGEVNLGSVSPSSFPAYETIPYDPLRNRENIRGTIALLLIGLMAATILVSFVMLWIHPDRSKELHELLALTFGPLVALVGAATGYYFGSQSVNKS